MHDVGDPAHRGERAVGHRVEVDAPLVGPLDVGPPGVPRVELDRRHLHRPDHLGQLGDAQLVGVQAVAREVDAHGLQPRRGAVRHPLLVDLLAADAGREAVQHARPLAQGVDDARPDGEVVLDEVELGGPGRREVHAVGVRDAHRPPADVELDRRSLGHDRTVTAPPRPGGICPRADRPDPGGSAQIEERYRGGRSMRGSRMEPGEFAGVAGRTLEESTPSWPPLPAAPRRRAERRHRPARRRRLRAVRLLRVRHRDADVRPPRRRRPALQQLPHHGAVLADAGLPADRAQPPPQRDGPHRRVRLRLPRLRRDDAEGQRVPVGGARRATATRRSPSASGTSRRRPRWRWVRRASAGRSGAGSSASTASSAARPTSTTPTSCTTTTRSTRRARRRRATTCRRTSPTGRSATSPTCAPSRRRGRSSSTSRSAPATPRTTCRRPTATATAAASTTAGTAGARRSSPASRRAGCCRRAPQLSERPPWVAAWDSLGDDERRLYARMMEVYAGFLEHTDAQVGRVLDFIESLGELDDTIVLVMSDNGASAEGGPRGLVQRELLLQHGAREPRGEPPADRRPRRTATPTTTTRGAGRGPATRR